MTLAQLMGRLNARVRARFRYSDAILVTFFAGSSYWLNGLWWLIVSPRSFESTPSYDILELVGPEWAIGSLFIVSGVAPVVAQLLGASRWLRQGLMFLLLSCACLMFASITWANWASGAVPIYGFSIAAVMWALYLESSHDG